MEIHLLLIIISSIFALQGDASIARMRVKEGDRVPIPIVFGKGTAIEREVPAGVQIFHFAGPNKGKLIDEKGEVVRSSNYACEHGTLVIKNFSKADVGTYANEPNVRGSPTLIVEIE